MKKYITYILILITLIGLFSPIYKLQAQTNPQGTCISNGQIYTNWDQPSCKANNPNGNVSWIQNGGPKGNCTSNGQTYTGYDEASCKANSPNAVWAGPYVLLAPLPCQNGDTGCIQDAKGNWVLTSFDPSSASGDNKIGGYLNVMIKIFIGLCAVLAVVMIVIGGIEYMTTELISSKEAGKERIRGAIFGLLLALGAWTLLNQINPDLLKSDLKSLINVTVPVTLDTTNFAKTEQTAASVGTGYKADGTPSSGVSDFAKNNGAALTTITVDTVTKTANFCTSANNCVSVPVNLGYNGVAQAGQAQSGDMKTPIGTTTITSSMVANNGKAVVANGYNFGAAYVNIGATINGVDRGIGFHGSANDALGTTAGCIRMSNENLAALAPYMKPGVKVTIK